GNRNKIIMKCWRTGRQTGTISDGRESREVGDRGGVERGRNENLQ
ncbi:hypothetical protein A2U01_0055239, partial [Trifolium medium]|nr:hypothetical protein [Trifolium medium]